MYSFRKSKKGFTLIELMVVVAIIGVLVLLGLRAYSSQKQRAMNAIAKANASTIQTMLVGYMGDHEISGDDYAADIRLAIGANDNDETSKATVIESMVNPYSTGLAVYRIDDSETSIFEDASGSTASTEFNGMVDVLFWKNNYLLVNARGAKGETIMDIPLPANKY